ncbi:MAG: GNAT family N-acetyltransferase [Deltaproteobacteria bacterium]
MLVRQARFSDIPGLLAIEEASHEDPWGRSAFSKAMDPAFTHSHLWVSCVVGTSRILGYICFQYILDEIYVVNLTTSRDMRRRGVASRLLGLCLAWGKRHGATRAILDVREGNIPARRLYEKFGFRQAGARKGSLLLEISL